MRVPIVIEKMAEEAAAPPKRKKRKYMSPQGEEYVPTYKEMRKAKIHDNMSNEEKWAYRGKHVQRGYMTGGVLGGALGSTLGFGFGHVLERKGVLKGRTGNIVKNWILPPVVGLPMYRSSTNAGKISGEEYARKKLNESGNNIQYVSPLSLSDRGSFDPAFMGTLTATKIVQQALKESTQDAVKKGIDSGAMCKALSCIKKYLKR